MFRLLNFSGNPNVGVFARATERHVFVPPALSARERADVEGALEVAPVATSLAGTNLVGSLLAANGHGVVVGDVALRRELAVLRRTGLDVLVLDHRLNAAGNNLLVNDAGALVNPEFPDRLVRRIEATLGVPVQRGTLAGLGTVGMAGVATNQGVLVHPKASADEREAARRALGRETLAGTINHGTALIGAGLLANSKGAVIGAASTGIEVARVEDALGFLPVPPPRG